MGGTGGLAMFQQYVHEAAAPLVLGETPFSKILTFLTLVATEKHLKTQAKQTTKIKIQMEKAHENIFYQSCDLAGLTESTILRMTLVVTGMV